MAQFVVVQSICFVLFSAEGTILLLVGDGSFNRKPEACAIVSGQRIKRTPPACG